jgi:hypothetical protein
MLKTNVSEISSVPIFRAVVDVRPTLMMKRKEISKTLACNITLTWLIGREDFNTFIGRESFKSWVIIK